MTSWLDDYKNRVATQAAPQAPQTTRITELSESTSLFTLRTGVFLPLMQSIASGIIAGLTCYAWAIAASLEEPAQLAAVITLSVTFFAWIFFISGWAGLVNLLERVFRSDINGDGRIGDKPKMQTIQVRVTSEDGRHTTIQEFGNAAKLKKFAQLVLSGTPITRREWTGRGKLYGEDEFKDVKDKFIKHGWMIWKDPSYPQLGLQLTATGAAAMRAISEYDPDTEDE